MRINNPIIPYDGPIQGGLKPGMTVYFKGTVHHNITRFHINLQAHCDRTMHFNPRFKPQRVVVFNTFRHRRWECEERVQTVPFNPGESFEVLFVVTCEGYQVVVNGAPFYLFKHRIPVQRVTGLQIGGDVSMETVIIGEGSVQICPPPKQVLGGEMSKICSGVGSIMPMPIVVPILCGLKHGMSLSFKGSIPQDIKRFHINLQSGVESGCNKALHFNPRFDGTVVVVFNTFRRGSWENEERPSEMPFRKGEDFEIVMNVTAQGYEVNVNGRLFHVFKHRMPADTATAIKIAGDVIMRSLNIEMGMGAKTPGAAKGPAKEIEKPICEVPARPAKQVNPNMEYIYGGLRCGMSLYFKGTVPKDAKRFSINLHCGSAQGCDNAFHFNPRLDSNLVVFNTMRKGGWEKEERPKEMPFRRGEDFEVVYRITAEGYQVNVNGNPFYFFKHRMPFEDVTAIRFVLDVNMEIINVIEGGEGGLQGYLTQGRILVPNEDSYTGTIYGGLREGMYLYFRGTVNPRVDSFSINLQYSQQRGYVKAMHFNPRFKHDPMVVFNTLTRRKWQREERVLRMPFCKGESFEVLICVDKKAYRVYVNGCPFYTYKHRVPLQHVNIIRIKGDVSMDTVDIIGGGKGMAWFRGLRTILVPKIPHVEPIFGGLRVGTYLYFQGKVPNDINRFHINLQWGQMPGSVISLHFNPRFTPSEVVVFNTFQDGKWENEERVDQMPFRKGQSFEVVIIVTTVGYQVVVNGRPFYLFKHRMPVFLVSALNIGGDVSMQTVHMINGVQGALEGHPSLGKMVVTKIPHVGPIYGGLRMGMALYFRGTVPQKCNRFSINLQLGQSNESDNAFHFNPRFDSNLVVFNTYRNGKWENEERPTGMPFRKGEDFEIVFLVIAQGFQVNVNGRFFHVFMHRMPLEHVAAIRITDDVTIQTINITEAGKLGILRHPGLGRMTISSIPFVGTIQGCLRTGIYMYFRGKVPQQIKRFHINLQYGQLPGCDKALHFNPRFDPEEVVVFNSFRNGSWEQEERVHRMPFCKGKDFEMVIIVTQLGYQVIVNGRPLHLFGYRMPVEHVNALEIGGDVSMESLQLMPRGHALAGIGRIVVSKIPHVGPVYGGLRTGMFMFFRGTIPQQIDRFAINLQYGELEGSDIALHFNPRFDSNVVVFNTYRNDQWEKEERVYEIPFQKGKNFELIYIITPKGYQVAINGRQFYFFEHRMPVEHVSAVKINGDISVQTVDTIGGEVDEEEQEGLPDFGRLVINKIPHVGPIHRCLRTGIALYFQGTLPEQTNSFAINLQFGQTEDCNKALHFNPRFTPCEVVVFNTFRNGSWEQEERVFNMPFTPGEEFEIIILVTSQGFQVYVNGEKFYLFLHRMPMELVSGINIAGDVSMETIDMKQQEPEEVEKKPEEKVVLRSISDVGPIYGGLRPGMSIYFKGTVPDDANRFSLNLHSVEPEKYDNIFHFNPRFDSSVVVFNTYKNGWGNEERPTEMPFHTGEDFEVLYIITSEGYQVKVNGNDFYFFKHRIPLEKVAFIRVFGDVSVQIVNIIEGGQEGIPEQLSLGNIVVNTIPHVGPIYGGVRKGMYLYFRGKIDDDISRFNINLQYGEKEDCEKALHFNPRFEPTQVVVFNTFRNGTWEKEERVGEMPFTKGEDFELVINVTPKGYQFIVNGRLFYLFMHRMPVEQVSTLAIDGDISIESINTIGSGPRGILGYRGLRNILVTKIPHVGPVFGGLRTGTYLYFRGTVPETIKSFFINLQYGQRKGCDIPFHFKPQFEPHEAVVFNTFRNGKWDTVDVVRQMPFTKGKEFELAIFIISEGYQVVVNGRLFYLFKHRMPVEHIGALAIEGDVTIQAADMLVGGEGGVHPSLGKMVVTKIPHVGPVYGGLRSGMYLYFKGTIPQQIKNFAINLQYGQVEGCDIALHFNPRFDPSEVVVFNTFQNGNWQQEERVDAMPFTKGEDFELLLILTLRGFQVNVNGRQFYLFKHRMPVEHVSAIKIVGDISVQNVDMTEGGQEEEQPDEEQTVQIPHLRSVRGGLRPGMYLYFKGTIPQNIKRFSINLQYGQTKDTDIALHFNPRFDTEEVVVFNTLRNGNWENEERPTEMPFRKGEDFEVFIFVTTTGYQVNVNGRQFHLFNHRMPVDQVSALNVVGDVTMQTINLIRGGPGGVPGQPGLGKVVVTKIPHVGPVYGGLRPGMYLYFWGTIPHTIESFHINLQCGQISGCDKALHFNPRFQPSEVVVFNSFRSGKWETEERVDVMPFQKGGRFELFIIVTSEGFQVVVNGRPFYLFKHRIPVEHVTAVKIGGDVSVQTINTIMSGPKQGQPGLGKMVITTIPHVGPVYGGLRPGMSLFFRGTVPQNINRFSIDLQCGEFDGCDKALHFNPRFKPSEVVVFNSFRNGKWEKEETVDEMPFEPGESFELLIMVTSKGYKVKVNGRVFYTFLHRMPVVYVSAVKIAGDITMETGDITEGGDEEAEKEKVIPSIPQVGLISGGLVPGMALYFHGTIPQKVNRFSINLNCGETEGCDNAFHFNPRFDTSEVVFNTFQNGSWKEEEVVKEMPFDAGEDFELAFIVLLEGYQVKVNDREFHFFKHRIPVVNVTAIKIVGDVSIQSTNITEGGTATMQGRLSQGKMVVDSMPFVGQIHSGLRMGMYLYFRGIIPQEINGFSINLECGEKKGCEKALVFKSQFQPLEVVVFNSFQNGNWDTEEKVDGLPFTKGEPFELLFIVMTNGYQVIANGRRFFLFKHRIPVERVSAIKIVGDVSMETIDMIGGTIQGYRGLQKIAVTRIPHVGPVFGGLRTGMYLYFRGTIPQEINRFFINLQYGQVKDSDIAIHFNPRFDTNVVVFNTFRNGRWENEETPTEMPFHKGEDFEVLYIITAEGYQVNVNGRAFHLFKHRMPLEHVSALLIGGNITMQTVDMIGGGEGGLHPSLANMVVTKIPHVGPVYGGLRTGMFLTFRGTLPEEIKSFSINLQYGQLNDADIALHFNPRIDSNVVVFNTFRSGKWEEEEKPSEMPFQKGKDFETVILINPEGYQVYVNGRHFYLFKHRMPVEHVSAIKIVGDVTMKTVNMIEGGEGAPKLPPPGPVVVSTTPHLEPITGGLRPGMYLYFKGTVPQAVKRFSINLQYGQIEGCDRALHFNPRFDTEEVVVFNSFKNGNWEKEEKPTEMPFKKGKDFETVIVITTEGYQVFVNGRQFHLFKHRMPVEQVSAIEILGDVSIQHINMIEGGQRQLTLGKIEITKIPHVEATYGGLRPGMYLYFKGTVPQEIKSFAINLQYGQIEGSDIAFHFNPRFDPSPVVVFNSFKNGTWEKEERVDVMPFTKGGEFEVVYIITLEGYQVNINGRQYYLFKHRMPVEHVSAVNITGDISMKTLNMIPEGQTVEGHGKIEVPSIPHVGPVYGGLRPGMALFFRGTIPEDIQSFAINLQYGTMKGSDIAFHFNPRFEPSDVVVFNSFKNGNWEKEERVEAMPFVHGESFEMAILVTVEGYQVIINGQRYHLFKHRMPVEHISALEITGTIFIQSANMIAGGDVQIKEKPVVEEKVPETLPHVEHVPGNLVTGKALFFKGTIPSEIASFAINLLCGYTKDSDIAFHFNPRFEPTKAVVLNSFQKGSWETEEKVDEMPFNKGESFELVYIITAEGFQVYVNRRKFCFFKHRIPVEKVNAVQVVGEVFIQTTSCIDEVEVQKEDVPEIKPTEDIVVTQSVPVPTGLRTGMSVFFPSTIPQDITRFYVDLSCGDTEGSDTAFRLSAQFKPSEQVVFNSFQNGQWGEEEKVDGMPFIKGEGFLLFILVTPVGYQAIVNGIPFHLFKHRIDMGQVRAVKVFGNITVQNITVHEEVIPEPKKKPEEEVKEVIQSQVPVPGSLKTGTTLTFKGVIPKESRKFSINLQCADTPGSDIAFLFNPQFETSLVMFNTFRNGVWEEAEVVDKMPFTRGESFVLVYIITLEGYQVTINGTEFYLFKHRIPLEQVRTLQVAGDVSVPTIDVVEGAGQYPTPAELGTVQFLEPVQGTLKTGTTLTFQGTVPDVTKRFSINLKCGDTKESDIAFHFSPQFETSVVVFNTFRNGSWEEAEKVEKMPFTLGKPFVVVYIITLEGYQVTIDGTEFYLFKHRIPLEQVRGLHVAGDVLMKIVNVQEPVPKYPSPAQLGPVQSVAPMPGNMKVGMSMAFKGIIPMEITRFCINLQTGVTEASDTALHINLLFDTSEVVFNTFRNGSWEEAEKVAGMPFTKGQAFVLVIIITAEGYQINVNDKQFYLFKHRISFDQVRCLQVIGNVSMETVNIIQETVRSFTSPARIGPVQSVVPMPESLKSGMSMSFEGKIPKNVTCFCINLQCGDTEDCDTAFHFSPQFETSEVVFNSFQQGAWGEQEKVHEMPFCKGQSFVLLINITSAGYQVKVNGNELYLFKHRIPVKRVTALQVIGNISIETVNIIETAPSVTPLPGGLALGTTVTFLGIIPNESTGFNIDLQCGTAEGSDTAFRFCPQFDPSPAVVFNSCRNGSWETEERVDVMPFHKGEDFQLVMIITSEGYQVNINGHEFYLFKHRIPVEQVRALQIAGNVNMPTVNIVEGAMLGLHGTASFETVVVTSGPIVVPIPDGLKEGTSVSYKITVPQNIPRFSIDLMGGEAAGCDLALHFDAQFEPEEVAVFNSFQSGAWGQEERVAPIAFHRGDSFELLFMVTKAGYQVKVNGADFHMFAHRIPVDHVTAMQIDGNINLETVNIIQGGVFDMGCLDQMAVSGSMGGQWTCEVQEIPMSQIQH